MANGTAKRRADVSLEVTVKRWLWILGRRGKSKAALEHSVYSKR